MCGRGRMEGWLSRGHCVFVRAGESGRVVVAGSLLVCAGGGEWKGDVARGMRRGASLSRRWYWRSWVPARPQLCAATGTDAAYKSLLNDLLPVVGRLVADTQVGQHARGGGGGGGVCVCACVY